MSDDRPHGWTEPVFVSSDPHGPQPDGSPGRPPTHSPTQPPPGADADGEDGPPPPPWVRRRTRRRRRTMLVIAVVLLVAVPVLLVSAGLFDVPRAPEEPTADAPDPDDTPESEPDAGADDALELEPPDPAAHTGSDADFARLLVGVEASERAMLRFQRQVAETHAEDLSAAERTTTLSAVAADAAQQLGDARDELSAPLATGGAERVRVIYLDHLESWYALMSDAARDPTLLGARGDTARYNRVINATALAFARALETELPDDADQEIADYADDLLDRGFRFDADAQV